MQTSLKIKIQDLLGDDIDATLIPGYKDFGISAFNSVADMIPIDSDLWKNDSLNTTFDNVNIQLNDGATRHKIIRVFKFTRSARQITYEEHIKGEDVNSIYYNNASAKQPTWAMGPTGVVHIRPLTMSGTMDPIVYSWIYLTDFDDTLTSLVSATTSTGKGFPEEAIYAGCLKTALNLMTSLVTNATRDDEDGELVQLLQAQFAALEKSFQMEIERITKPFLSLGEQETESVIRSIK